MSLPATAKVPFGGDHNPEQWPEDVWDQDYRLVDAAGRLICLATGTGAHPPWLARAHPEGTRVDFEGRRHRFGQRHNSCPGSPVFRRLSNGVVSLREDR